MIRKTAAALAVAAGILGTVGLAGPAFAASEDGAANLGEFVLWRDANFQGSVFDTNADLANYSTKNWINLTPSVTLNDQASSIANYSTSNIRAYEHPSNGGAYISVLPYGQTSGATSYAYFNLGNFDDKLSSHDFL